MSYKVNVALDKGIDLSDEAPEGEACHVAIDLDPKLLREDPGELKRHLQASFEACINAIMDEIRQHQQNSNRHSKRSSSIRSISTVPNRGTSARSNAMNGSASAMSNSLARNGWHGKSLAHETLSEQLQDEPATRGQRRAIKSVCDRLHLAPSIAAFNHHFNSGKFTKRQASLLIRQLRGLERNPTQAQCYLGLCTNLNRAEPAKGAGGGAHCHCCAACS